MQVQTLGPPAVSPASRKMLKSLFLFLCLSARHSLRVACQLPQWACAGSFAVCTREVKTYSLYGVLSSCMHVRHFRRTDGQPSAR